jgi:hypothetical protein
MKRRIAPANTIPPAVASAPLVWGARWRLVQTISLVSRFTAAKWP